MVLVRVRDDDEVDAPVPGGNARVQGRDEPVRVRPSVHEDAAAALAGEEDRVALSHVEDLEAGTAVRGAGRADEEARGEDGDDERDEADAPAGAPARRPRGPGGAGSCLDRLR